MSLDQELGLKGAQSEVIRAICCSWRRIAPQPEVIRAIFFEDSPCCDGPHREQPTDRVGE